MLGLVESPNYSLFRGKKVSKFSKLYSIPLAVVLGSLLSGCGSDGGSSKSQSVSSVSAKSVNNAREAGKSSAASVKRSSQAASVAKAKAFVEHYKKAIFDKYPASALVNNSKLHGAIKQYADAILQYYHQYKSGKAKSPSLEDYAMLGDGVLYVVAKDLSENAGNSKQLEQYKSAYGKVVSAYKQLQSKNSQLEKYNNAYKNAYGQAVAAYKKAREDLLSNNEVVEQANKQLAEMTQKYNSAKEAKEALELLKQKAESDLSSLQMELNEKKAKLSESEKKAEEEAAKYAAALESRQNLQSQWVNFYNGKSAEWKSNVSSMQSAWSSRDAATGNVNVEFKANPNDDETYSISSFGLRGVSSSSGLKAVLKNAAGEEVASVDKAFDEYGNPTSAFDSALSNVKLSLPVADIEKYSVVVSGDMSLGGMDSLKSITFNFVVTPHAVCTSSVATIAPLYDGDEFHIVKTLHNKEGLAGSSMVVSYELSNEVTGRKEVLFDSNGRSVMSTAFGGSLSDVHHLTIDVDAAYAKPEEDPTSMF